MKHIKYFNQLNEKYSLSDEVRFFSEFDSKEDALQDLEYYTKTINELDQKGGDVYRLVFLDDLDDLDHSHLGKHWCIDLEQLQNFYSSLSNGSHPYLIIAHIEPKQVDLDSFLIYQELPHELEINLLSNPTNYSIQKYTGNIESKLIWENQ